MTEIQMFQTVQVTEAAAMILFLAFGHLIFEFVSDFDIRPALAQLIQFRLPARALDHPLS
jgi:hypothetical protein